jgi:hypothetical protein
MTHGAVGPFTDGLRVESETSSSEDWNLALETLEKLARRHVARRRRYPGVGQTFTGITLAA